MFSNDQNHFRNWKRMINLSERLDFSCQGQDIFETDRQLCLQSQGIKAVRVQMISKEVKLEHV